jgi:pantoate--beta-alanine ligase
VELIRSIEAMRAFVRGARAAGRTVGLMPTMGYLHEGHLSLLRRALAECDAAVVSIYVNPTQFGPTEDLARYPRDLERDLALCRAEGASAVFHPTDAEMYPWGPPLTRVTVAGLSEGLCGRSRPTHFAGVATVVCKLFAIVEPDRAYFGEKDFQQLEVVRRMTADLNLPVEVIGCPIVREADGLAMSSRNASLSADARAQATVLRRGLLRAAESFAAGERDAATLCEVARRVIAEAPLAEVDYVEVVDPRNMAPVVTVGERALIAVAVHFPGARLIDNVLL